MWFRNELSLLAEVSLYFYTKTNQMHQCIKLFYFGMTLYMFPFSKHRNLTTTKKRYTACVMSEIIQKFPNFTAEINAFCSTQPKRRKCDLSLGFLFSSQYKVLKEDITVKYTSRVNLPGVECTPCALNRCLVRAPRLESCLRQTCMTHASQFSFISHSVSNTWQIWCDTSLLWTWAGLAECNSVRTLITNTYQQPFSRQL